MIRRTHELLAAVAKAWSDFMEMVQIDHVRAQARMRRALWFRSPKASRYRWRLEREESLILPRSPVTG